MTAVELLRKQFEWAHGTLDGTVGDSSHDTLHFTDLGKALSVGAAYAHAVMGEDMVLSTMLANKKSVYEDGQPTGISLPLPSHAEWEKHELWAKTVTVDLSVCMAYSKRVYQATDAYLSTLKDEDLDKEMDIPGMGKQSVASVLSNFLVLHLANLAGEISAAKGVQGLKGYPW